MKKSIFVITISFTMLVITASSQAQHHQPAKRDTQRTTVRDTLPKKVIGGVQIDSTKSIAENLSQSKDHTMLVAALRISGLADTLNNSRASFTLFAPSDAAFSKLPQGTIDTTSVQGKINLSNIIKNHLVRGKLTSRDLALAISRGKGSATLKPLSGGALKVSVNADNHLEITDDNGNVALVTTFDAKQSNGVIHVINNVLLPK